MFYFHIVYSLQQTTRFSNTQVVRLRGRMRRNLGRDGQVFIGELQSLEPEDGEVWSRHGRDLKISETSPG